MSKAVFNPGNPGTPAIPAVAAVAAVAAVEPTITLTVTPREARVIMGLIGPTIGGAGFPVYLAINALVDKDLIAGPNTDYVYAQLEGCSGSINSDLI